MKSEIMPIGVVVSEADPLASLEKVVSFGMSTCQMSVPPEEWWSSERIRLIRETAEEKKIKITSLIFGVELVNPVTREKRVLKVFSYSDVALEMGVKVIQAHIGFISENTSDSNYNPASVK